MATTVPEPPPATTSAFDLSTPAPSSAPTTTPTTAPTADPGATVRESSESPGVAAATPPEAAEIPGRTAALPPAGRGDGDTRPLAQRFAEDEGRQ
ncbi:hypothetical protein AB0I81_00325 [Nonomuraea sp. NPDC050404]|uniref:hypothetical protein n=1 Tax=Nonomuraea sp. NPDC050404 TaxID=3155783 RepID=UPI0033EF32DF